MRSRASFLLGEAKSNQLLASGGKCQTYPSWREAGISSPDAPVLVVASYLFASQSLSTAILDDLADWLQSLCQSTDGVALLVYLNSTNPHANLNYDYFKTLMGLNPCSHRPTEVTVEFLKRRSSPNPDRESFLHELLILKGS